MNFFRKYFFKLTFKNTVTFLFLWLMSGFFLGTLTLMGPVRWAATFFRSSNFDGDYENLVVKIIIMMFVISSFFIAVFLTRVISNAVVRFPKIAIPIIISVLAVSALWYWMNPSSTPINEAMEADIRTEKGSFTFGPYPVEEDIKRLKEEGYSAIIPLLHTAVVPFEPKLLADEISSAGKAGMEIIHVPMLPWISENEESIKKITELAQNGEGKYYIHCYLGKDRVNVVRTLIERYGTVTSADRKRTQRNLENKKFFERGDVIKIADSIFVTPYPTDGEFTSYFFSGNIKQIISLLNPDVPGDNRWIEKEEKLIELYGVNYELFPVTKKTSEKELFILIDKIKEMPKPIIIHAFKIPSSSTTKFIEAFNKRYK